MLVGCIALGDGEEAGEASLGGKVVVVVGQQGVVGGVVANTEHVQFGVVEFGEIGLVNESLHFGRQRLGALPIGEVAFHRVEAGHEVAAVAGADEEVVSLLACEMNTVVQ